jgi:hypothetical protein
MTAEAPQPTRQIDPTREYVVGGSLRWYGAYGEALTALPLPIDDLTAELGDDIYERMLRDPGCAAPVNVLRTAILEDGLQLRPAVDDADDDGYDQAKELVDLCERQIADLETSIDDVLWDMLSALPLGNRVAEEVYDYDSSYTGRTELVLRRLNVKPRRNLSFVVDAYGNVIGLLGAEPGQPLLNGARLSQDQLDLVIPRSKFAVFSFRPKDNDPRGDSLLRPVYNPWWMKMQLWPEYLRYLIQFASPSIDGMVAPPAIPGQPDDVPIYTSDGHPTGQVQTAEEAFLAKLLAFRNGTAIARPHGSELNMLWSTGEGQAFLNAFSMFDKQMAKGILYQTLSTEEASFGTKAQGSIHETVLETIIRQAKRAVCRMARRDVLAQIVMGNAGADRRALTPKATLGDAESQNLPQLWTAAAQLQRAGYFDGSQLPAVDELLNLPTRAATPPPQQLGQGDTAPAPGEPTPAPAPAPADEPQDDEEPPL